METSAFSEESKKLPQRSSRTLHSRSGVLSRQSSQTSVPVAHKSKSDRAAASKEGKVVAKNAGGRGEDTPRSGGVPQHVTSSRHVTMRLGPSGTTPRGSVLAAPRKRQGATYLRGADLSLDKGQTDTSNTAQGHVSTRSKKRAQSDTEQVTASTLDPSRKGVSKGALGQQSAEKSGGATKRAKNIRSPAPGPAPTPMYTRSHGHQFSNIYYCLTCFSSFDTVEEKNEHQKRYYKLIGMIS